MEKYYPVQKYKVVLNIILSLLVLTLCILLQIFDPDAMMLLGIANYVTMVIAFYYAVLYTLDLFAKNAGVAIDENGIYLNYGYFKHMRLPWESVTAVNDEKHLVTVVVNDVDLYVSRLPIITRVLLYSQKKRFNTIFCLRGYLLGMKIDVLHSVLEDAMTRFKE